MPQSLSHVIVHFVWSTKYRERNLTPEVRPALHAYLATVSRNMECPCYRVNGVEDHVHLAIRLSRTVTQAALVEELKTSSSKWLKGQAPHLEQFAWQRGYAAFSVYYKEVERLLAYIDGQEEHHRKQDFQDEYRALLKEHNLEFDERYVWD